MLVMITEDIDWPWRTAITITTSTVVMSTYSCVIKDQSESIGNGKTNTLHRPSNASICQTSPGPAVILYVLLSTTGFLIFLKFGPKHRLELAGPLNVHEMVLFEG